MTKLNPCPQCGNEPDILTLESVTSVFCNHCENETEIQSGSANGAINAWNAATREQPIKTLRDEFAMAAISNIKSFTNGPQKSAEYAYKVADAMLKEREK